MKYSIYVFLDNKGKPYYVGKTNDLKRRKKEHLAEIKAMNQLPKYRKARYLMKRGHPFRMKAIARALKESDAYAIERFYIQKYRKAGIKLFNLTAGGPDEKPIKINNPKKKPKKKVKKKSKKRKVMKRK
jgi:excinuclease UvrABC nuclease subunit